MGKPTNVRAVYFYFIRPSSNSSSTSLLPKSQQFIECGSLTTGRLYSAEDHHTAY